MVKKIHNFLTKEKQLQGGVKSYTYFVYYKYYKKPRTRILGIYIYSTKIEFSVYLKKQDNQEKIDEKWELNKDKGNYPKGFEWKIIIKDENDCERFINLIKEYLEKSKKFSKNNK